MKLIMAVVPHDKTANLITELVSKKFRATELASAGGFLKKKSSTILVGVEDNLLDEALQLIRNTQGSIAFVLAVERFEKI
ncbi:MAG: cyclic-di-AMP receptor [Candidatus Omnitrophica bacterium]|nr:cyclic-di-AMP receptor [Candidatus Omnitrophota bacterium]